MADSPVIKRPSETVDFEEEVAARKSLKATGEASDRGASEAAKPQVVPPAGKSTSDARPQTTTQVPARQPQRRSRLRPILFLLLPVALIGGGYLYVTGGKVMSTDNAYVEADQIGVSTDVAGTVIEVAVHENEMVKKGQLLYRLRPDTYKIALDGAKAQLNAVHDQILTLKASYDLSLQQIRQAEADLAYYQTNFNRQQDLAASGAASKSTFDTANHDLIATRQKIEVAKVQAQVALAQLGGDANQTIEQNPLYLQAKSAVDTAQTDLNDTVVRAPFDGIVTGVNSIQVGSYLQASQQAFHLVSSSHLWVTASPKETELTWVKPGQSAVISVDTYPGIEWKGTVESISPASGSSFSLLPAQNTTGNWVKVVQRLPVRIAFDPLPKGLILHAGLSAKISVDTEQQRHLFGTH